jgi:hypothetical protein
VPPADPNAESAFDPVTLPHSTNAPAYTEVVRTTTEVRKRRGPLAALAIFSACAALGATLLRTHLTPSEAPAPAAAATPLPAFVPSRPSAAASVEGRELREVPAVPASARPEATAASPFASVAPLSRPVSAAKKSKPKRAAPKSGKTPTSAKPSAAPRDTKHTKLLEQYGI